MLDESLLDAPEALARADTRGLLRGAAEAGARVRTAARHAAEAGIAELKPDGRPRAVLVAGPGPATGCIADLLGALAGGATPVSRLAPHRRRPRRGRAALGAARLGGPARPAALATPDGTEPGLRAWSSRRTAAAARSSPWRRPGTPLTEEPAAGTDWRVPLALVPYADGARGPAVPEPGAAPSRRAAEPPDVLWALLTPLLVLLDRIGLLTGRAAAPRRRSPTGSTRSPSAAARPSPRTATRPRPSPPSSPTPSR